MERQENELLPGCRNPEYSVFPASLNPDRLIGSVNPGHGGGLVGRHYFADSGKEGEGTIAFWLEQMFQKIPSLHRVLMKRGRRLSLELTK